MEERINQLKIDYNLSFLPLLKDVGLLKGFYEEKHRIWRKSKIKYLKSNIIKESKLLKKLQKEEAKEKKKK
ncbi:hypothetical protein LCGC14_1317900 [marine sediment metagenome]|uniref:Uncharacterized protein n=1 Tax=marine sediment metagenome TaxID=412755 RepID=A0A0F9KKE4_9ZZZZ